MSEPMYPAARAVAAKVKAHFAARIGVARERGRSELAPAPDADAIEAMIDAAFWASLRREEGFTPKISLALLPPDQAGHPLRFEQQLPLDARGAGEAGAGGRTSRHPPRRLARRHQWIARDPASLGHDAQPSGLLLRDRGHRFRPARRQGSQRADRQVHQRRGARRRSDQVRRRTRRRRAGLPGPAAIAARLRHLGAERARPSTCWCSSRRRCARTAAAARCW